MLDPSRLPLTCGTTRLRPMTDRDAAAYAAGTADEAVRRFAHLPEPSYAAASVRAMIREVLEPGLSSGTLAVLALADAATDAFVGSMVIFDVGSGSAEVGFWTHPQARGRGHARRGVELAARFSSMSGLRTLRARTAPANAGSRHCLLATGFHEVDRRQGTTPAGQQEELIHYQRELAPDTSSGSVGALP